MELPSHSVLLGESPGSLSALRRPCICCVILHSALVFSSPCPEGGCREWEWCSAGFQRVHIDEHTQTSVYLPHPPQLPAHKHKVAFLLEWFLPLTAEALTGKSVNCLSYDIGYYKESHLFRTLMTKFDYTL